MKKFFPFLRRHSLLVLALLGLVAFTEPYPGTPPPTRTKPLPTLARRSHDDPSKLGKSRPSPLSNDPLGFTVRSNEVRLRVGQPLRLTITVRHLNLPPSLLFTFPEANAFRLKLLVPEGFVVTGGTYHDYIGSTIAFGQPPLTYTVEGHFTHLPTQPQFRLLRGGGQATEQRLFVEKARLSVTVLPYRDQAARLAAFTTCVEAENGNGNRSIFSDGQASGGQSMGGFGNASEFMEYTLSNVPSGGSYTLRLFYVSGDSQAGIGLVVNGGSAQTVTAPGVGRPLGPYVEKTTTINLNQGNNTLRVQGSGQGGFLLDKFCLESDNNPSASLVINPSGPQSAGPEAGSLSVSVTATDVTWSASSSDGSWLTVNPSTGNANGSVTVSYAANPATSARSASISFSGPAVTTQTLTLNQAGTTANPGYAQCVEAENGNGNRSIFSDGQASGGQSMGGFGNASEFMEYTLSNVPSGGSYTLRLFYVSGDSQAGIGLVVNGGSAQTVTAPGVGRPLGPYVEKTTTINLNQGNNTLRVQGSGQGGFLLDKLCVERGSTTPCTPPTLSLGTPACNGTSTYSVGFTAQSGANVTASAGTVQGSQVVNIPVGTNATVTASLNGCTSQQTVTSCTSSTCLASFQRALVMGNSITLHGGTGQNPGDFIVNAQNAQRGMAATAPDKDFVRLLAAKHRVGNPAIVFRTLADFNMDGTLDAATGPFIEDRITRPNASEFYGEITPRFNAVATFAPNILYMRIGENIDDGELAQIGQAEFRTRYKFLIDKLISGDASCKVVLSTSVWDKPNFDQAVRAVAAERGYPIADFSDMWPNRNTNSYYAINPNIYSSQAVSEHPDDDGMARIAADLWAKTPCSPPVTPGNPNTAFNYPTVPIGTVGGWNGYNPKIISGEEQQPILIGDVYRFENQFLRVEIRKGMGGAVQITNRADGKELINHDDQGRGSEICLYSGPKNYAVAGGGQWFDIGYNPILQGNDQGVPSEITSAGVVQGNDGKTYFYTRTRMISWASGAPGTSNPPVSTDTYAEKWTTLDGKSVPVKMRIINNRTDETFYNGDVGAEFNGAQGFRKYYEGVAQEYPNMFISAGGHQGNVKYYVGPSPYTGDTDPKYLITTDNRETPTQSFVEGVFKLSEPYMAVEYDRTGKYIFLNTERMSSGGTGVTVPEVSNETGEDVGHAMITRASASLIMDPKGTWYHSYNYYVTDNFAEGRNWANSLPRVHGDVPNWTFSRDRGRNDWRVSHGIDQKEPFTSDNWQCVMQPTADGGQPTARRSALVSPAVSHKASAISTIYLRIKYAGPATGFKLRFDRNAQSDQSYTPKRQAAQAPDGLVNGGAQAINFNVLNDGQFHTIAIPTAGHPEWKNVIQQYQIQYQDGPVIGQDDRIEVSYFGVNNPGN